MLNRGGKSQIDNGLGHRRVDELHRAAGEDKTIAIEDDVSAGEIGAAENDWVRNRSAHLQVGRPTDAERAADEVHVIRGVHGEIQRNVLRESLRRRSFYAAGELI